MTKPKRAVSEAGSRGEMRAVVTDRLRAAREMAGLSQGQVAKLMGMHRPTISELEAGRRRVSAEELAEFARHYGVSMSWLTGDDREASSPELQLAARELSKLKPADLQRVIKLLEALRPEK